MIAGSPLAAALERTDRNTIRLLCASTALTPTALARVGRRHHHIAGWLKRDIAQTLSRPVAELFPDDFEDEQR